MADENNDDTPHASLPMATLRALKEQTTPELTRMAREYARGRVKLLRWVGRPTSQLYARELVDDAHADTWTGDLPWDPSRCSLLEHLRQAIKQRTWLEIRHGCRVAYVALQEPANDEAVPEQIVSNEVECALVEASPKCSPIMLQAMLGATCRELRPQVANDDEAAAVVQCWEDGITERDAVMNRTGLTEAGYERVRKRLLYASGDLSAALRAAAQDLLRNAS